MEIYNTDISEKNEFDRLGYHYTRVMEDSDNRIYVYKLKAIDPDWKIPYEQYEVVKGVKRKNPDGKTVFVYPSDEQFGRYGYYVCGTAERCKQNIEKRISYLKTLK